jgi:hypothetical protein
MLLFDFVIGQVMSGLYRAQETTGHHEFIEVQISFAIGAHMRREGCYR